MHEFTGGIQVTTHYDFNFVKLERGFIFITMVGILRNQSITVH